MPKALKDLKKETAEKKDEAESAAKYIDLKEFLGVPAYKLTIRDERAQAALNAKCRQSKCDQAEYDEALDSYLKTRYPWRRDRTEKACKLSDKGNIQGKLRDIYRYIIEHDFASIFKIGTEMQYFHVSFKEFPLQYMPRYFSLKLTDRTKDIHRKIFCYSVSNAIGRLEILWDSLRTIPELVDQLNPMDKIIHELCLFRDFTNFSPKPDFPEHKQEAVIRFNDYLASAARSAYFIIQFIAYMYLDTESLSTSSAKAKYKHCTVSMDDFNEIYQLLTDAAEELPMLEENICDKLGEIFKLKSREEAKKHDWFNFFTFSDWSWLLGRERSFLDLVASSESTSATASSGTVVDGSSALQCCVKFGADFCPDCLETLEGMLIGTQKVALSVSLNIEQYDKYFYDMLRNYTRFPSTGFSNDEALKTLHALAVELPRFMSCDVNKFVSGIVHMVKFHFQDKLKVSKASGHFLRLQFLEQMALLRSYTYETTDSIALDDTSLDKYAEYCQGSLRNVNKRMEDYTVCVVKLLRDLK